MKSNNSIKIKKAFSLFLSGLVVFTIACFFSWLGGSFYDLEWQSINPADWQVETRALLYCWALACLVAFPCIALLDCD